MAAAVGAAYAERDLSAAVALVTGGTRGIGKQLVAELRKRGATVICLARAAPAAADAVDGVDYRSCDISVPADVKATLADVKTKYGYLDIVVNNAGIMPGIFMDPLSLSDELDEASFKTNLLGAHFVTKHALPLLFASPGKLQRTVVMVSSSAGYLTEPEDGNGMLAYRASKAGENGLMVALNELYVKDSPTAVTTRGGEAAPKLHRVVSVHPGFVATGLGLETATGDFKDAASYAAVKPSWGAISVEDGTDTLLWTVAAADGIVKSGGFYYQRTLHSM